MNEHLVNSWNWRPRSDRKSRNRNYDEKQNKNKSNVHKTVEDNHENIIHVKARVIVRERKSLKSSAQTQREKQKDRAPSYWFVKRYIKRETRFKCNSCDGCSWFASFATTLPLLHVLYWYNDSRLSKVDNIMKGQCTNSKTDLKVLHTSNLSRHHPIFTYGWISGI